jgi:hypothetical protein
MPAEQLAFLHALGDHAEGVRQVISKLLFRDVDPSALDRLALAASATSHAAYHPAFDARRTADFGAGLSRHQRVQALGQLPFWLVREALVEQASDDQAKHSVAEEFQSVIAIAADAGMSDRALEQLEVARRPAQGCLQERREIAHGR